MVNKERKVNHGVTNLVNTTRSDVNNNNNDINTSYKQPQQYTRSWTHKLLAPDMYQPTMVLDHVREIKNTATWKPVPIYQRDFSTIASESYIDPKDRPPPYEHHTVTSEEVKRNNTIKQEQKESMQVLCDEAKLLFGTTASMLKSFHKKLGDTITLDEFNKYIVRNKIDQVLNSNDQKRIFDYVDPNNKGIVPVSDLLKKAEEVEFRNIIHEKKMLDIRNFLKYHVEKHRNSSTNSIKDIDLEERKKTKALKGESNLLKSALGQRTFDVDVHPRDLQDTIDGLFLNPPTDPDDRKFARFLRHSNLNLNLVPFYDMRHEELENLKTRAAMIDRTIESPSKLGKLKELSKYKCLPSLATITREDLEKELNVSKSLPNLKLPNQANNTTDDFNNVNNDHNNLLNDNDNKKPYRNLVTDRSMGNHLSIHSSRKDLQEDIYLDGIRNTMNHSTASLADNNHNHNNANSVYSDNTPVSKSSNMKGNLFDLHKNNDSDFYIQIIEEGSSMHHMKDSNKVMRVEKLTQDVNTIPSNGKRSIYKNPTDWSRVGVGGNNNNMGFHNNNDNDPFLTTNAKFYPPLHYESSKPVTRDLVSDAEISFAKKNYQRNERYARLKANTDVTKIRLEYEEIEKEIRQNRRDHARLENRIRYSTTMFLNDLQCYKSKPLQRMAKMQNVVVADRMWGGHQDKQTVLLIPENRDFKTTYNSSFDSNILTTKSIQL